METPSNSSNSTASGSLASANQVPLTDTNASKNAAGQTIVSLAGRDQVPLGDVNASKDA